MRTHSMDACAAACALAICTSAFAANGRIAADMPRDARIAAQQRAPAPLKPVASTCDAPRADPACRNDAKPRPKAI